MLRTLSIAVALLMLASIAFAFDLEVANPVHIFGEQKEISVTIKNTSDKDKELKFAFYAPLKYTIDYIPGEVKAQSYQTIKITFFPETEVENSIYNAVLSVSLDDETIEKNMKIYYHGEKNSQTGEENNSGNFTSGFFSFVGTPLLINAEMVFNVILVIIAAVLLIAFISRLTKRIR